MHVDERDSLCSAFPCKGLNLPSGTAGSSSSLLLSSLELNDAHVYEPYIRAHLVTAGYEP